MTGIELRTSGVWSDRSANWATTTAQTDYLMYTESTSLTRLLVYFFNFGHLQQLNFAQKHSMFSRSWFKILPKTKYALQIFCQSGEI